MLNFKYKILRRGTFVGFFLWGDINVIFVIEKTMCCGETPQNMQHERNTLAFARIFFMG